MVPLDLFLLCMLGVLIGAISALLGVGGGFFYVPALVLLFGIDPRIAVGTSLAIITCTTLSASIGYGLQGQVLMKSAACLALPGMAFAAFGALITAFLPSQYLVALFCVVLLFMGIKMIYRKFPLVFPLLVGPCWKERFGKLHEKGEELFVYPVHLVTWGSLAGFMSGLTGIGGGIVNVPALTIGGIPIHFAVATSAVVILITSLSATGTHLALGNLSIPFFVAIAAGAVAGAQVGVRLSPKAPPRMLELAVGTLLIVVVAALVVNTHLI
ncbi:MAG TPA: sulfite exporter TauE/SafE family protein [Methanolinea sp.]|jgi:uncharacterized membrane protein YfcA|nr:MAG: Sulfite exporter TauE/SafE [Methanoregulaceae archaeon PtaB.Bin009]OPY39554.1 MAG: Sulfite exporter TauE/SafE [Methanoregulaceae archaeon PtaU1.Bin066]HII76953.1 sulfite exporter TauE/SafE family protein [Methanolinea sp.]HNQ29958.1 sulfite exporter TauE/SafE family protein [Methanolinea sp.]